MTNESEKKPRGNPAVNAVNKAEAKARAKLLAALTPWIQLRNAQADLGAGGSDVDDLGAAETLGTHLRAKGV